MSVLFSQLVRFNTDKTKCKLIQLRQVWRICYDSYTAAENNRNHWLPTKVQTKSKNCSMLLFFLNVLSNFISDLKLRNLCLHWVGCSLFFRIVSPGICAMCGKKVLDTKNYKQTSVWRRADQRTVLQENDGCENETDGACLSPSWSYFQYFYLHVLSLTAITL